MFNELSFTLAPNSLLPELFAREAAGAAFTDVFVAGYDTSGSSPFKVVDDTFHLARTTSLTTQDDGSVQVSIEYGALQEQAFAPGTGSSGPRFSSESFDSQTGRQGEILDSSGAPQDSLPVPACYCPGTRIATPGGDVAVEALEVGDAVLTADGRSLPVVWIGRRSYARRFLAGRRDLLPVTIRVDALAPGVPVRDLVVSPQHAMLLDGLLVPAWLLVNGATITQASRADAVHYLHIELPRHEAILAEGAAAESYSDGGNRGAFHNAHERPGERPPGPPVLCAPVALDGFALQQVRDRIAARAGLRDAA